MEIIVDCLASHVTEIDDIWPTRGMLIVPTLHNFVPPNSSV